MRSNSERGISQIIIVIIVVLVVGGLYVGYMQMNPTNQKIKQIGESLNRSAVDVSPEVKPYWDKSEELLNQIKQEKPSPERVKKVEAALAEIDKALAIEPKNPKLWSRRCGINSWIRDLDDNATKTLNSCKKAEELDPNNIVYINGVGDELLFQKKYEEAILQFQKTLRLQENYPHKSGYAYKSLGDAYKGLAIYDKARENYQKAIETFTGENKEGQYDKQILETQKAMADLPQ